MSSIPLAYVTIPFALGIISQRESWVIMVVMVAGSLLLRITNKIPVIVFAMLGFALSAATEVKNEIAYGSQVEVVVRVDQTPIVKGRWQRTESSVVAFKDSTGLWKEAPQKLQTYIDTASLIGLGDTLCFKTRHYPAAPYLLNRGITGRVYGYKVQRLGSDTTLRERASLLRDELSGRISQINTHPRNTALMQALTLGDKSGIDRELRSDYNRTGAAHMLAVSGLHVGIIFLVLSYLLGWIKVFHRGIEIYSAVIILILWYYALLTGFSPSVLRAVIMFSLYQTGIAISRSTNNVNVLMAAGLILLVADPNYLYDVGFQLSFLAMFGIVLLYDKVYALWRNRLWSIVAVTVAAQIAVLPLSCYYFGNIPLLGVVTNLALWMIVPAIIVLTFAYLLTGAGAVGELAAWVANIQNEMIAYGSSKSWIAVEDINMPFSLLIVIYVGIISVLYFVNATGLPNFIRRKS